MPLAGVGGGESMNKFDAADQLSLWLSQPLCRFYAAGIFSAATVQVTGADDTQNQAVHWALGCMGGGELELLGAWNEQGQGAVAHASLVADLEIRGVESMRALVGTDLGDVVSTSRSRVLFDATELPSVERTLAAILPQVEPCYRRALANAFRAVLVAGRGRAVDAAMSVAEAGPLGERYAPLVAQWRALMSRWAPVFELPVAQRRLVLAGDRLAADLHKGLVRAIARHGPFTDSAAALGFVARALQRVERRLDRKPAACRAAVGRRARRLGIAGRLAVAGG
jgi:transposase-like protein